MKRKHWLLAFLVMLFPFLIAADKKPLVLNAGVPGQVRSGDYIEGLGPNANPSNLLSSGTGGMELWPEGTGNAPFGTALVLTPTVAQITGIKGYGSVGPYAARVTATGAGDEGISITLATLEASTVYSISVWTKATAGDTTSVITTGCVSNINTDTTATSWTLVTGTCTTDATPTNIVIQLVASADTDIADFEGLSVTKSPIPAAFAEGPMMGERRLQFFANTTVGTTTTSEAWTVIGMDGEDFDPAGKYNLSTDRYTPGEDGHYLIIGCVGFNPGVDGKVYQHGVLKNGSITYPGTGGPHAAGTSGITPCSSVLLFLDENDYAQCAGTQNTGGNVDTLGNNNSFCAGYKID